MKIIEIETSVVSLPFEMGGPHASFAGVPWTNLDILLVRVETADGIVGWGEAFGHVAIPSTKAALDTVVAPLVLGRDSSNIAAISSDVLQAVHLLGRNGPFVYAYSGIEIALWDIAGKRAGKPLHRLLGSTADPGPLPAYASLLRYGSDDLVARNTAAACAQGYRHIKLHELTREAVLAAQAAANGASGGAPTRIMLDVNCPWPVTQACAMADTLRHDNLLWLEEPVWPPEDCQGLARVRRRGVPIAAGENVAGMHGFQALIQAGAIDIAQPSVTKIGGIGEMVSIISACKAQDIQIAPHSPYFGPGLLASMHICAALIVEPLVEMLWLDMEANPFDPWVRAVDGHVRLPPGPGLGCDPDPKVLARYQSGVPVRHVFQG